MSFASNMARAVATPMPSSAPKVVPSAINHSPSIRGTILSFSKSKTLSLFFSQTMSMCDCKHTQGLFSYPAVAALRIITLPISSLWCSKFLASAQESRYAVILASCFEGLGTDKISPKNLNTPSGFNPFNTLFSVISFDVFVC